MRVLTCIGTAVSAAVKASNPRNTLARTAAEDDRPGLASIMYAIMMEKNQLMKACLNATHWQEMFDESILVEKSASQKFDDDD